MAFKSSLWGLCALLVASLCASNAARACTTIEQTSDAQPETRINPGDCMWSPDGHYTLIMQPDGAMALYDLKNPTPAVWSPPANGPTPAGTYAAITNDGNFILRAPDGHELWRSSPSFVPPGYHGDFYLMIGNGGRMELHAGRDPGDPQNGLIWNTKSECELIRRATPGADAIVRAGDCMWSQGAPYALIMQPEGRLALYKTGTPAAIWSPPANGPTGFLTRAQLKDTGDFVLLNRDGAELWRAPISLPAGTPSGFKGDFFLLLAPTGQLQVYKGIDDKDPARVLLWASALPPVPDTAGECTCHLRNSDGSAGQRWGQSRNDICGGNDCRAYCSNEEDNLGNPLTGIYHGGSGKCQSF